MEGYRIHYDVDEFGLSGCMDVPLRDKTEALQAFWERARDKFSEALADHGGVDANLDITMIEAKTFQVCKECGQPMGNLGLVFDECVNPACPRYANAERQD